MNQQAPAGVAPTNTKGKDRQKEQPAPNSPTVPPDFVLATASDGSRYAAPNYLIPTAALAMRTESIKQSLRVGAAAGGAHPHNYGPALAIGDNPVVSCPPDPGFTERELLNLHAEVLALMEQLGISYKDAAHRLYMAEAKAAVAEGNAALEAHSLSCQVQTGLEFIIRQPVAKSRESEKKDS